MTVAAGARPRDSAFSKGSQNVEILLYPDPRLKQPASRIAAVTQEIREQAQEMISTMYAANGVGLAAVQVGLSVRMLVLDTSEERNAPRVYVNPKIVSFQGKLLAEEGCLSFPGIYGKVERAERVVVAAQDLDGNLIEEESSGLRSRAFQHEVDHLDGILFITRLSPGEKLSIRKALRDLERDGKNAKRLSARPEALTRAVVEL